MVELPIDALREATKNQGVAMAKKIGPEHHFADSSVRRVGRPKNVELRSREYLVPQEVDALMEAAKKSGRHRHRDATLILLAYRHGLRASEVLALRWSQVDFANARLHVVRRKNGLPSVHPLAGVELRALRRLARENPAAEFVFLTERGAPMTTDNFARVLARSAKAAGIEMQIHPHMLRHACGYRLANMGIDTRTVQAYIGHRNIQHTTLYTQLSAQRFVGLWDD